jgi:hypothetical protein
LLLPCFFLVIVWLLPDYSLVTSRFLPGYCFVASWLLFLLPSYFLVTTKLLHDYCLFPSRLPVTARLLSGYFMLTFSLLPGYCLVTSWSSVSPKDEICFICSCAITFQLASTVSPSVVQHAYTSCCSVSYSVNPDLYASQIFITVYPTARTYTKMPFGNWKREVRACPLVAFQLGGHLQKILQRGQLTRGNFPDYWFWPSLHNFSS